MIYPLFGIGMGEKVWVGVFGFKYEAIGQCISCECDGLECQCVGVYQSMIEGVCEGVPESVTATAAGERNCQDFSQVMFGTIQVWKYIPILRYL